MKNLLIVLIAGALFSSCNGLKSIKEAFSDQPPYETYLKSLKSAGLENTTLMNKWVEAGKSALTDSIFIDLPYKEKGYFSDSEPDARSYRFQAKEGKLLQIDSDVQSEQNGQLFLDLFFYKESQWKAIAHSDSAAILKYEVEDDGYYLLRIQPSLLNSAYYNLTINSNPILINPVQGATNRSIGSFYGAPRDAGARSHEGLDIFAKRGTPVVAPTDGYVSRVGTNNLGGNVVWLRDNKRGQSYYFAHLDQQLVSSGERVKQGDTLGLVGNTGNAKNTPPHLHFGIYSSGSKDPLAWVKVAEKMIDDFKIDSVQFSSLFVTTSKTLNLRSGPGTNFTPIDQLANNTILKIIGQFQDWFRIELPNNQQGFVFKNLIKPTGSGEPLTIKKDQTLLSQASADSIPITQLLANSKVSVLGRYNQFQFVRTLDGQSGWISE
ncbi:peptidoglycan DD-metalloendopeptidase family protein [Fulvivirga ligni]|uniref:peptidoglycan DD-metalloendopeptidase family protein n=1 Tax=Fulvivirga ligni TaxID=2904246 RepID=UPI001F276AAF|nr:peptidoglycan DD-metalloendopeptidase family protein [Fulvivirga ligni]UII22152.1 M23 family metallopeptidase [Fulvivirga ligni]